MNKKTLLTLLVALMLGAMGMNAANYGINVAGVEVSTSNYNNVTGGNIAAGTVKYDPTNKVLTLTDVSIARTGGDNYGVHNRSVDGLTIRFYGTNNIQSDLANALHLDKSTTVECMSGSTTTLRMTAGNNFGRGVVYVNGVTATFDGPGTLNVYGITKSGGSYDPVGFEGTKNSGSDNVLTFSNSINLVVNGSWKSFYKFSVVRFYTCDVKAVMALYDGTPFGQIGNVTYGSSTNCVTPADVEFNTSNKTFKPVSGATVTEYELRYLHITSSWALKFTTAQFPDANFRSYLRSLCGTYSGFTEHYFTSTQLQNRTSLDVSGKSISNLTGVTRLTYLKTLYCGSNSLTSLPTLPSSLTYLNCVSNRLTSLPSLPSSLTYLNCNNNQLTSLPSLPGSLTDLYCSSNSLTSLPTLPSGIQSVYAGGNRFTTLTVSLKYSLKTLDVSSCTSLTTLTAYGNSALTSLVYSGCTALKSLTCDDNNLPSLGALPSSVTEFACYNNRLMWLPTLPSGLQKLQCYGNRLTSLPSSLPASLTYLDCGNNQLTKLPDLPSTIQTIKANNNSFTTLSIYQNHYLSTLDVSNCTSLLELNCYDNALTSLNYSGCTVLQQLNCHDNNLTSLGALPGTVNSLNCSHNSLSSLPTLPSGIWTVYAGSNKFTTLTITGKSSLHTLDVSSCTSLTELNCNSNALTYLNVNGCSALKTLRCASNQLTSLGTLPNYIEAVYAGSNKFTTLSILNMSSLKTLDVSSCTSLTELNCYNNALTSLSVSGCTALKTLKCYSNQLTSLGTLPNGIQNIYAGSNKFTTLSITGKSSLKTLDVSNNTSLTVLHCYDDALTYLNVNGCSALKTLRCASNQLTSLPSLPGTLTSLTCSRNQLTSLPTLPSGLTELDCSDNQIKSLPTLPSGLTSLGCANNQLSTLSVMNLSKLGTLICYGNKLTSLSVQGCNSLFMIQCFQNQIKGAEMTALVSSLPTMPDDGFSYGYLAVLFNTGEGNEISNSDVNIARDKGWIPCEFDGTNWVEIVNAGLPGDVDGSGAVDVTDVNIIINITLGKAQAASYPGNADVSGDGTIDVTDVNTVINIVLGKQ